MALNYNFMQLKYAISRLGWIFLSQPTALLTGEMDGISLKSASPGKMNGLFDGPLATLKGPFLDRKL